MQYRVLTDKMPPGRFQQGSVHELTRAVVRIVCDQAGLDPLETFMPAHLGKHWSEKPAVAVLPLDGGIRLAPVIVRDTAELDYQIAELQERQAKVTDELEMDKSVYATLDLQVRDQVRRYQFTGLGHQEFTALAALRDERDAVLTSFEGSQLKLLAQVAQLERLKRQREEQPLAEVTAALAALRDLALTLVQHDAGLMVDTLRAQPAHAGEVRYTHGPGAAEAHRLYLDALSAITGKPAHESLALPEVVELVRWARTVAGEEIVERISGKPEFDAAVKK